MKYLVNSCSMSFKLQHLSVGYPDISVQLLPIGRQRRHNHGPRKQRRRRRRAREQISSQGLNRHQRPNPQLTAFQRLVRGGERWLITSFTFCHEPTKYNPRGKYIYIYYVTPTFVQELSHMSLSSPRFFALHKNDDQTYRLSGFFPRGVFRNPPAHAPTTVTKQQTSTTCAHQLLELVCHLGFYDEAKMVTLLFVSCALSRKKRFFFFFQTDHVSPLWHRIYENCILFALLFLWFHTVTEG